MTDVISSPIEIRVLGALIEKQLTTPEYYPLSLNALTNACNQKNNREPVVNYNEQTVQATLDGLRSKKMVVRVTGGESRVPKYRHNFDEALGLAPAEVALLCELMLRGPQTAAELRSRAERMFIFDDLAAVEAILESLATTAKPPLVMKLPRQPGQRERRYAHLLAGEPVLADAFEPPTADQMSVTVALVADKIAQLETEVDRLRQQIAELQQQLDTFRKQFE